VSEQQRVHRAQVLTLGLRDQVCRVRRVLLALRVRPLERVRAVPLDRAVLVRMRPVRMCRAHRVREAQRIRRALGTNLERWTRHAPAQDRVQKVRLDRVPRLRRVHRTRLIRRMRLGPKPHPSRNRALHPRLKPLGLKVSHVRRARGTAKESGDTEQAALQLWTADCFENCVGPFVSYIALI
jgi:hypothetical protein